MHKFIKAGADATIKNSNGETALAVAKQLKTSTSDQQQMTKIIEVLQSLHGNMQLVVVVVVCCCCCCCIVVVAAVAAVAVLMLLLMLLVDVVDVVVDVDVDVVALFSWWLISLLL